MRNSQPDNPVEQQHLELLRLINHNPAFRAQVQNDPTAALAQLGLTLDPTAVPEQVILPSTTALESGIEELTAAPAQRFIPWIHFLTEETTLH